MNERMQESTNRTEKRREDEKERRGCGEEMK